MRRAINHLVIALSLVIAVGSLAACSDKENKQQLVQKPVKKEVLVYSLQDLDHRVADHTSPDAIVYVAPGYNPKQPIHLIVYNHGMTTNLNDVEKMWEIGKSMKEAAPNTVLVAPEWAVDPAALSEKAGKFHQPGFFKGMLEEIFSKTPDLKGRTQRDVKDIRLSSFSGGLYALASELERNGLEDKVVNVTLYDSLYKGFALDPWLKRNITQLASGKKQYHNFYFHTWPASIQQMQRVRKMLAQFSPEKASTKFDTADAYTVLESEKIASKGIIYKYTMAGIDDNWMGHNAVPRVYLPQCLKAAGMTCSEEKSEIAKRSEVKVKRVM